MAHRLEPNKGGSYLPPAEVVRRLEGEFAFVEADSATGAEQVDSMIRQFERMRAPAEVIAEHRDLRPCAISVVVADTPEFADAYLSFVAMPGRELLVGYHSARHEREA